MFKAIVLLHQSAVQPVTATSIDKAAATAIYEAPAPYRALVTATATASTTTTATATAETAATGARQYLYWSLFNKVPYLLPCCVLSLPITC